MWGKTEKKSQYKIRLNKHLSDERYTSIIIMQLTKKTIV